MAESKQVVEKILIKDLEIDLDKLDPEIDPELGINDYLNGSRDTILGYAIYGLNLELFKAILKTVNKPNGCNINQPTFRTSTPILQCLFHRNQSYLLSEPSKSKSIEMISSLLEAGANLKFYQCSGVYGITHKPLDYILNEFPGFKSLMNSGEILSIPSYLTITQRIIFSAMLPDKVIQTFQFLNENNFLVKKNNDIVMEYFNDPVDFKEFTHNEQSEIFFRNLFKISLLCYQERLETKKYVISENTSEISKEVIASQIKNLHENLATIDKAKIEKAVCDAKTQANSNFEQQYYNQLHQGYTHVELEVIKNQNDKIEKLEGQVLALSKNMQSLINMFEITLKDNRAYSNEITNSNNKSDSNNELSKPKLLLQFKNDLSRMSKELSTFEEPTSFEKDRTNDYYCIIQ